MEDLNKKERKKVEKADTRLAEIKTEIASEEIFKDKLDADFKLLEKVDPEYWNFINNIKLPNDPDGFRVKVFIRIDSGKFASKEVDRKRVIITDSGNTWAKASTLQRDGNTIATVIPTEKGRKFVCQTEYGDFTVRINLKI